jgi:hypothetical protein
MKTRFAVAWPVIGLLSASCGGNGSAGGAGTGSQANSGTSTQASYPGADVGLPPVAAGFVRYETKPVMVPVDQDVMWEEWVAPPIDGDMDVVAVTGKQSVGGHHAILYGMSNSQPVGTSHAWQEADQLTSRTLGGIGGEGNDSVELPAGVVFRVAKGSALMIQSHYINASGAPLEARTVLDVKLGRVDPTAQVASLLANASVTVSIPPGGRTTADVSCKVQKDLPVLMYANHMHNLGVSASTELINPDGTTTPLKVDASWDPSWAFHPNYTRFTLQAPRIIPAGSTIHTTCTWSNPGSTTISFPDEMCTFAGFLLGGSDAACVNGTWQ